MLTGVALYAKEILDRLQGFDLNVVEVGVYRGDLSRLLLSDTRIGHLYMVDSYLSAEFQPEPYRATGDFHAAMTASEQLEAMNVALAATKHATMRRTMLAFESKQAALAVYDRSQDAVFLDGDHSYEGLKSDIETWLPKLKTRGLLCGHDYGRPGPCAGVKQAVDEAVEEHLWKLDLGKDFTWFVRL